MRHRCPFYTLMSILKSLPIYLHQELHYFLFKYTSSTEIYTLSLHDALPIYLHHEWHYKPVGFVSYGGDAARSEEHTSELQSHVKLVCRLLLEKKNVRDAARSDENTS